MQQTRWLPNVTSETIDALILAGNRKTSPFSVVAVQSAHGAISRVPLHATAFGLRQKHFLVGIIAAWEPPHDGDQHRKWSRDVSEQLATLALPGGYPNLLGPDETAQIAVAYGNNTARLREVKSRFDPEGVFAATALPV